MTCRRRYPVTHFAQAMSRRTGSALHSFEEFSRSDFKHASQRFQHSETGFPAAILKLRDVRSADA